MIKFYIYYIYIYIIVVNLKRYPILIDTEIYRSISQIGTVSLRDWLPYFKLHYRSYKPITHLNCKLGKIKTKMKMSSSKTYKIIKIINATNTNYSINILQTVNVACSTSAFKKLKYHVKY